MQLRQRRGKAEPSPLPRRRRVLSPRMKLALEVESGESDTKHRGSRFTQPIGWNARSRPSARFVES
jgi:hypothetical protein